MPGAVSVGTKSKIFEKIKLYVSFIDKDSKSQDNFYSNKLAGFVVAETRKLCNLFSLP